MGFGSFTKKCIHFGLIVIPALIAANAAADSSKKAKRQHHAHEHGAAKLHIAIEGKQALIEFETPAESMFGFEHAPKKQSEKDLVTRILKDLETNPGTYFIFDKAFACTFSKSAARHAIEEKEEKKGSGHGHSHAKSKDKGGHHGEHSEVHVRTLATCEKELKDTSITIGLFKKFNRLQRIDTQILSSATQKASTLNPKNAAITF